jgi:hypothetical protein
VPNRRHPAYEAVFEAYLRSGTSVRRAIKLIEEMWDPNLYGADIPSEGTIRLWAKEDDWEPICRAYALQNKPRIRQAINADILLTMPDMLNVVRDVAHDTNPEHAKINSVRMGAARTFLQFGGAGILENRQGDMPEYDIEGQEAVARIRGMTPEEVLDAETKELAGEAYDQSA